MTAESWDQPPVPRRGRWALGLALAAAVVGLGLIARPGPESGAVLPVERAPAGTAERAGGTTPSPSPLASPVPTVRGRWAESPDAPMDVPASHLGVWTGTELLVGFQPTVAGYDPGTGTWRALPPVPGPERVRPLVVRAGRDVVVLGGSTPGDTGGHRDDGLLLDVDAQRWHPVAPAPAAPLWDPVAVWTGAEVVWWGGARPGDAHEVGEWPVRGAAYRPGEDRWRALAEAPVAGVYFSAGLWTGREVVVWGTHHPPGRRLTDEAGPAFAAAYDPAADTWRRLPAPPLDNPAEAAAVWTGREVVLWGRPPGRPHAELPAVVGAALDPGAAEDGWRFLPHVDSGGDAATVYGLAAVWTGRHAVFYGGYPRSVALVHDPDAGAWWQLPAQRARVGAVAAWTGTELLLWGGYTPTGPDVDLWTFQPDTRGPVAPRP